MALGAVAAVRAAGRAGSIVVAGFDNISAVQQLIRTARCSRPPTSTATGSRCTASSTRCEMLAQKASPADRETPVDLITAAHPAGDRAARADRARRRRRRSPCSRARRHRPRRACRRGARARRRERRRQEHVLATHRRGVLPRDAADAPARRCRVVSGQSRTDAEARRRPPRAPGTQLVPTLSVAENVWLGRPFPSRFGFVRTGQLEGASRAALARVGLDAVDVSRAAGTLGTRPAAVGRDRARALGRRAAAVARRAHRLARAARSRVPRKRRSGR